jgi:threonine dehydrogenase-like Zn-dependent dehydrogenase
VDGRLEMRQHALWCHGQLVDRARALERVVDRVSDRGADADNPGLAHAFRAERVRRCGGILEKQCLDRGHLECCWQQIVHERRGAGTAVLVVNELLEQRPAESLGDAAGGLAGDEHRVDRLTALSRAERASHLDAAIDIGRHLGATVYATASEPKHDRLRQLGAEPLAYDDERVTQLQAMVVFDPVGGAVFERSLAALAPGGRLVTPGAVDNPIVQLNLWLLIGKRTRIIGTGSASVTTEQLDHLIQLAGNGELNPVIDRELPLAEAAEAHRLIEARETFGKIVLRP